MWFFSVKITLLQIEKVTFFFGARIKIKIIFRNIFLEKKYNTQSLYEENDGN